MRQYACQSTDAPLWSSDGGGRNALDTCSLIRCAVRLLISVLGLTLLVSSCSAWGWGRNTSGLLGDGSTTDRTSPVEVGLRIEWKVVETGLADSCGIRSDNSLWCWGDNAAGEVGDGTLIQRITPVRIGTDQWVAISVGGDHTCGIKDDTTLWCWGNNDFGQLGGGTTSDSSVPHLAVVLRFLGCVRGIGAHVRDPIRQHVVVFWSQRYGPVGQRDHDEHK